MDYSILKALGGAVLFLLGVFLMWRLLPARLFWGVLVFAIIVFPFVHDPTGAQRPMAELVVVRLVTAVGGAFLLSLPVAGAIYLLRLLSRQSKGVAHQR